MRGSPRTSSHSMSMKLMLACVCRCNHPLARCPRIGFRHLAGETIISFSGNTMSGLLLREAFQFASPSILLSKPVLAWVFPSIWTVPVVAKHFVESLKKWLRE